jgi:hypothetical protein
MNEVEQMAEQMAQLQSFEEAFDNDGSAARETCDCGRIFYNPDGGWTWEPGELVSLATNPNATPLAWGVEMVIFEGKHYVKDCPCWKPRAMKIMQWLQAHAHSIAEFLTLEKKRKQQAADAMPTVK